MTKLLTTLFAGLLCLPAHAETPVPQGPVRKLVRAASVAAHAKHGLESAAKAPAKRADDGPGVGAYVVGGIVLLMLLGGLAEKLGSDR